MYHELFQGLNIINLFIPYQKTPCGKYYYCLYFTDKETETSHLKIR